MSAVLIELSTDRYWGLLESRRRNLGILADTYRHATPVRVIRPTSPRDAGWSMPVHAEDEMVMRGIVEGVATGSATYYGPEELRALLPSAGAR